MKTTKRFKLSLGAETGWMFQDHEKYKDDHKNKSYNLEHLNAFQYGLTGRIGYGKWALNGYYALTGIFEKDKVRILFRSPLEYPLLRNQNWSLTDRLFKYSRFFLDTQDEVFTKKADENPA